MNETPMTNPEKISFPQKRISNVDALRLLESATGLPPELLLEKIPELNNPDLAFGISWASQGFDESHEVGQYNARAVADFVYLRVPTFNVAGDKENDLSGIRRSYHMNTATKEIQGFSDFYAADRDLSDKYMKRISLEEMVRRVKKITEQKIG